MSSRKWKISFKRSLRLTILKLFGREPAFVSTRNSLRGRSSFAAWFHLTEYNKAQPQRFLPVRERTVKEDRINSESPSRRSVGHWNRSALPRALPRVHCFCSQTLAVSHRLSIPREIAPKCGTSVFCLEPIFHRYLRFHTAIEIKDKGTSARYYCDPCALHRNHPNSIPIHRKQCSSHTIRHG